MALRFLNSGYFAGKVGIGTESPTYKLVVGGDVDYSSGIGTTNAIFVQDANYPAVVVGVDNQNYGYIKWNVSGGYLSIATKENYANQDNTLVLKTGKVGIGTISPLVKLQIEGSAMPATTDPASVEDILTLYRNGSATVWSGGATLALGRYSTGGSSAPKSRLDFKLKGAAGSNTALPETTVMTMNSDGKVGIGTTLPSTDLQVIGTVRADVFGVQDDSTNPSGNTSTRVTSPAGATYDDQSNSASTGVLSVILPTTAASTMLSFTLRVFDYANNESFDVNVAGYWYGSGLWTNTSVRIESQGNVERNFNVRFGKNNTTNKGWVGVGETTTNWSYVKFAVLNFQAAHVNDDLERWNDLWDTAVLTSLTGYTTLVTKNNNQVNNWARNGENLYYGSGSGNVGIGVTAPTSSVHVNGLQTNSGSTSAHIPTGTMRLNFAGASSPDEYGASLVFTQRWWTGSTGEVAMGQITGVKETGNGNYGGGLAFFTSNNTSNNLLERLRINELGRVGIGETSPQAKLDIYDTFTKTAANPNTVEVFHAGNVSANNIYPVAGLFTQRVSGGSNSYATGLVGVADKQGDYGYIARGVQGIGKLSGNVSVNNADMQYMGVEGRIEMEGSNSVNLDDRAYSFYGTAEIDSGSHLKEYHGLYLNTPINNGTILNKYGISQVDGSSKNYFAGNVSIGSSSYEEKLVVDGSIKVGGEVYKSKSPSTAITPTASDWIDVFELASGKHHGEVAVEWNDVSAPSCCHNAYFQFKVGTSYGAGYTFGQDNYLEMTNSNAHNNLWLSAARIVDYGTTIRVQIKVDRTVVSGGFITKVLNTGQGNITALTPVINNTAYATLAAMNIGSIGGGEVQKAFGSRVRFAEITAFDDKVGIATTDPKSQLHVAGGIQMANDTDAAVADKAGTMRYRTDTEYVEVTGTELITNGDFATDTNWTKNAEWTISGGKANAANSVSYHRIIQSGVQLSNTTLYRLIFTVSNLTSGGVICVVGGTNGLGVTANGTYIQYVTSASTAGDALQIASNPTFTGSIDNVSLMEVTEEEASYADMCMQTGASTYEWVNIVRNTY